MNFFKYIFFVRFYYFVRFARLFQILFASSIVIITLLDSLFLLSLIKLLFSKSIFYTNKYFFNLISTLILYPIYLYIFNKTSYKWFYYDKNKLRNRLSFILIIAIEIAVTTLLFKLSK